MRFFSVVAESLPVSCGDGMAKPPSSLPFGSRECFVPDGVTGAQTDPLGNGSVLLLRLGELLLRAESLVALLGIASSALTLVVV